MPKLAKLTGQHLGLRINPLEISARLAITAVFCPGSKKGTVLLEGKILKKGPFKCYVTFLCVNFTPGLHRH